MFESFIVIIFIENRLRHTTAIRKERNVGRRRDGMSPKSIRACRAVIGFQSVVINRWIDISEDFLGQSRRVMAVGGRSSEKRPLEGRHGINA